MIITKLEEFVTANAKEEFEKICEGVLKILRRTLDTGPTYFSRPKHSNGAFYEKGVLENNVTAFTRSVGHDLMLMEPGLRRSFHSMFFLSLVFCCVFGVLGLFFFSYFSFRKHAGGISCD